MRRKTPSFWASVSTHLRTCPERLSPDGSVLPAYTPTTTSACSVIRITRPAAPGHFPFVPAFVAGTITGTPNVVPAHFLLPLPAAVAIPVRTPCSLSATAAAPHPSCALDELKERFNAPSPEVPLRDFISADVI